MSADKVTLDGLGEVVRRSLHQGKSVEIDGLGIFTPDPERGFRFQPLGQPQVFLAYVVEDADKVETIYEDLAAAGFNPWMDRRKLMPGQNWPRAIENAIETSDFFLPCFSSNSVDKRGAFQAEIHYGLDCARRIPLDEIFIVPVRFDVCRVPSRIRNEIQYVDLFPDWKRGIRRILRIMQHELDRRRKPATS
jgi:hypothetical protein